MLFAHFFTASLTVRTEPQSEIAATEGNTKQCEHRQRRSTHPTNKVNVLTWNHPNKMQHWSQCHLKSSEWRSTGHHKLSKSCPKLSKTQYQTKPTGEARTCEAWFQFTFRPQKWNLKAHMWYQLSPFPSSNAAIAMQHHPGNIHQSVATPRYSATPWYVLIQLPNVIDTISKR